MNPQDEPRELSSTVCYAPEIDVTASSWAEIKAWRKAQRQALIAHRMARDPADRNRLSEPVIACLRSTLNSARFPVLGVYWPIRGEIDLRALAHRHLQERGTVGLPVVVRDAALVEFWRWRPGGGLEARALEHSVAAGT